MEMSPEQALSTPRTGSRLVAVLLWLVPLAGTALLCGAYLQRQYEVAPYTIQRPLRHLLHTLTSPRAAPPAPVPGDVLLEMESAPDLGRNTAWETVRHADFSGGAAVATRKDGAELTFPVNLAPGTYTLFFRVWALPRWGENRARVQVGDQACTFAWPAGHGGSDRELTQTLVLSGPARQVRVRADRVSQRQLLLDRLLIRRGAETPGDSWPCYLGMVAAVAGLFAAAGCWGAFGWARLGLGAEGDPLTRLVLQLALGLGAVATAVTVLGTLGWFRLPVVAGLLALGLPLGARPLARTLGDWLATRRHDFSLGRLLVILPLAAGLAALAAAALCPATSMDQQTYHLPIAKWLILEGRFAYHRYQVTWGCPHNISNLFAVAQLLDNDEFFRTAQLCHAGLGLLWLTSVYALGKTLFGRAAGLAAVVLCVAIRLVPWELSTALVDLGFACFAGAALLAFVLALQEGEANRQARWLVLAALLAGVAAVCKVNGPAVAVALAVAAGLWLGRRRGWRAGLGWFALIGALSFAVACPMYVKNWVLYDNPLYLFTTLFPNRDLPPEFVRAYVAEAKAEDFNDMLHGAYPFWLWPYAWVRGEFMEPTSPGPGVLVGLLLLPALGRGWLRRYWPLLLAVALQVVLWLVISPLTRFTYPWVAVLLVLCCAPLSVRPLRWPGVLIPAALLLCAVPALALQAQELMPQWTHIAQRQSNERYLRWIEPATGTLPAALFDDIRQLNREYHERPWRGRVLIDAVHLAYADFDAVPAESYLQVRVLGGHEYAPAPGAPTNSPLAQHETRLGDRALLRELTGRLEVVRILLCRPAGGTPPSGRRLDGVFERWARDGLVRRRELSGSILYTFDPARLNAALGRAVAGR
jgi:hypothetical protein